ncbi:uncharacterized protein LOC144770364 [Lissotriton helveticus]
MEESTGKQNGSLVQARTCGTMIHHRSDTKWQTSQKHGLAQNGIRPSTTEISRGRDTTGLRVWTSVRSEHLKPRRKMEHNRYDPGSEIFERAQHLGLKWPAQMKTPVHRLHTPTSMPGSSLTSSAQKLRNCSIISKSPPPLLRHTVLPKNLNGRVSSSPNLVSDHRCHVNILEKPCLSSETFQSHLVNRITPSVKKDNIVHRSVLDERQTLSNNSLELHRTSSDTVNFGRGEQHSFKSNTMGDLKPINLCRTRDSKDSQYRGKGTDMEVTEPGKSATQCTTKVEIMEPSKYRRFLLIDSKGMPYTVLVEEPKPSSVKDPGVLPGAVGTSSSSGSTDVSSAPRKMYRCPICSRVFEYLSYLQRHSITHSQQKPYVCDACGKAFKRTSHLERHKYTHTVGKPYECQICQRSFRDTGELAHHHRVHTGERPFQCEMCHMRFGERNTLLRHVERKHQKQPLLESFTEYVSD